MMDLQEMFKDPIFRRNSIASVVFAILFPFYFGFAASGTLTMMPLSSGAGMVSNWNVTFNETVVSTSEDVCFADDGGSCEITLTFAETDEMKQMLKDGNLILGEVRFTLTYDETDENGQWPDQCDEMSAEVSAGDVSIAESGHEQSTTATDCEDSSLSIKLVNNYTGDGFSAANVSDSEIIAEWSEDGNGWGNYVITISVDTNTGSSPGPSGPAPGLSNNEDGEEVNVKMEVVAFVLELEDSA